MSKYFCSWKNLVTSGSDGGIPGEYPTPEGLKYWRYFVFVFHSPDYVLWEEGKPLGDGLLDLLKVGIL
jgi:hypothetical protein